MDTRRNVIRYRIAFSDCDPAQIAFYGNYFRWFDTASNEFMTACGVPNWRETERQRGIIGIPVIDVQADFLAPATYGEDIEIESFVDSWSGSSFVMRHIARRGDTVLARGREVRVFAVRDPADSLRIRVVPIPEDIKALCS